MGKLYLQACSAGFQTCCVADFQVGVALEIAQIAGLETRDTADLEVCATEATPSQIVWIVLLAIILSWCHYLDALPGRGLAVAPVSTGEQLLDHHLELVGLEMMQLDGAGRAFGGANAAAHALGGFDLPLAVLVAVGRGIRADGDAGHAGDT